MSNVTEIIFKVDAPGTARAALRQVDGLMSTMGSSAVAAGKKIDQSFDAITSRAQKAAIAVGQFNQSMLTNNRLASLGPQGEARGMMPSSRDSQFDQFKSGFLNTERINAANGATERLSVSAGKAHQNLKQVSGAMLSMSGIPASQALGQLSDLAGPKGAGILTAIGGFAVALKVVSDISADFLAMELKHLAMVTKSNQMNFTGMKGTEDETKADLAALFKLRDEMIRMDKIGVGGGDLLSEKVLGRAATLSEVSSKLEQAIRRASKFGNIDTREPREIEREKQAMEAGKQATEMFNAEARSRLEMANWEWDYKQKQIALDKAAAAARIEALKKEQEMKIRLNDLFTEGEKLRAGLGGEDLRSKAAADELARGEALAKVRASQVSGDDAAYRTALAQYEKLAMGGQSTGDRLAAEAKERQIALLQDQAATGVGPARELALDRLVAATSNTGALTSEQVDIRLKAIEDLMREQLDVTKDKNKQTVEITLKDESAGALKAQLGEAPTPENSGVYSDNSRTISDWAPSTRATGF
jgi:hypothetical protein